MKVLETSAVIDRLVSAEFGDRLVELLELAGDKWIPRQPMPTARNFARTVSFRGSLYVVGGSLEPMTSHAAQGCALVEAYR